MQTVCYSPQVRVCSGGNFDHLFLWHNFCSRYARKQIKSSKDADNSLVANENLSQKIGSLDWRLGPGEVGHKNT